MNQLNPCIIHVCENEEYSSIPITVIFPVQETGSGDGIWPKPMA